MLRVLQLLCLMETLHVGVLNKLLEHWRRHPDVGQIAQHAVKGISGFNSVCFCTFRIISILLSVSVITPGAKRRAHMLCLAFHTWLFLIGVVCPSSGSISSSPVESSAADIPGLSRTFQTSFFQCTLSKNNSTEMQTHSLTHVYACISM